MRQPARIPCWMDAADRRHPERRFGYIFEGEGGYPAICDLHDLPPLRDAVARSTVPAARSRS